MNLSTTSTTTRAAVAKGTWGTTTDALADAVEALGALGASSSFGGTAIFIAPEEAHQQAGGAM